MNASDTNSESTDVEAASKSTQETRIGNGYSARALARIRMASGASDRHPFSHNRDWNYFSEAPGSR